MPGTASIAWGNDVLNFAWDANAGGDNVTDYKLYYGNATGVYDGGRSPLSLGTVTTFKFAIIGGAHYFALTATNSNGESGFSTEVHQA